MFKHLAAALLYGMLIAALGWAQALLAHLSQRAWHMAWVMQGVPA